MKQHISLLIVGILISFCEIYGQDTMSKPINIGYKSDYFVYSSTLNTANYANAYVGALTNDIFYKFQVTKPTYITISHCGSEIGKTYVYLLNSSGERIDYSNGASGMDLCPDYSGPAFLRVLEIPAGTYYVVSEGQTQNGKITTTITGIPLRDFGSKAENFYYSPVNQYASAYKLTLTREMSINVTHCGSLMPQQTSILFFNSLGLCLARSTTNTSGDNCNNSLAHLHLKDLSAGTYYILSDGDHNIITHIKGQIAEPIIIDLGTKSETFNYTNTQNTHLLENAYIGQNTKDIFYKFTIPKTMDITLSHQGSEYIIGGTYIYLLDALMKPIASSDSIFEATYLQQINLSRGTYYVVSEGAEFNGIIKTTINGSPSLAVNYPAGSSIQNYIATITPRVSTSQIDNLPIADALHSLQYFDGLGRPIQTIQTGASPNSSDIVSIQSYDSSSRPEIEWLPVAIPGNEGSFVANFTSQATTFHKDANPYKETIYEASALNKITNKLGAGEVWHNAGKDIKSEYLTNTESGVLSVNHYTVSNNQLTKVGTYSPKQLYVEKIVDEDGKTCYSFTNKLGQLVLTRQTDNSTYVDTYYVYDEIGNKCFVLPPKIEDNLSDANLNLYAYQYKYDDSNQCVETKLPGVDSIYMVYDRSGRLLLKQTGNQRADSKWTINKYDCLGRLLYNAELTISGSHESLRNYFQDRLVTEMFSVEILANPMFDTGYSRNWYHQHPISLLTVNYYDNYDFLNLLTSKDKTALTYTEKSEYSKQYTNATGLLTGKRVYSLENPNSYTVTAYYYDERENTVQEIFTNQSGGSEKHYYNMSFAGKILKHLHQHSAPPKVAITEVYEYTYDHAERLTKMTHQINNGTIVTLAENTYNELGLLKNKNIHGGINTTQYTYNIRNWLTGISSPDFTQTLSYDGLYNGNIAQSTTDFTYIFRYDGLNRLTRAANPSYDVELTYDKHGNIINLSRYGVGGCVDKFYPAPTYKGNQLIQVKDNASFDPISKENMHFVDVTGKGSNFSYDQNGNMTKQTGKGMSDASYNLLNLPFSITYGKRFKTDYSYNAVGVKQSVKYRVSNLNALIEAGEVVSDDVIPDFNILETQMDYFGNIIYKNGKLNMILIPEGYIDKSGSSFVYHYYLKDHQGNNRVVLKQDGAIEQKYEYYPFGAICKSDYTGKQPFKYNGKELDRMRGLDWYDYSGRMQDPLLGRFVSIDPLCEKYYSVSPYAYCLNNPVRYIDPDGRSPYYDMKGNFLGVDESKFNGHIYIADAGFFLQHSSDGIINSKTIKTNSTPIEDVILNNEAESQIYTHIMLQTKGVDFSKLYKGKVSIRTGASMVNGTKVVHGFNDPDDYQRYGFGRTENGEFKVTVSSGAYRYDFQTVEAIQNYLGVHEYDGHGNKGFSGGKEPGGTHWKAYQLQVKHPTFKSLPENLKPEVLVRVSQYLFIENRKLFSKIFE